MGRIWLGALFAGIVASSSGATPAQEKSEPGFYVDEGKRSVTQINGGEFKDLMVKYPIADAAKTADYTIIRFYFRTVKWIAYQEFPRAAFLNQFKDQKGVSYWVVRSDDKAPDVVTHNYYGERAGGIGLVDLCESPRSTEKDVVHEVTASVKLHVKTGEKEEYRQAQKTWVKLPVYDEGQELWKATLSIQLKKLTGVRDKGGVVEVGIADPAIKTHDVDDKYDALQFKGVSFWLETGKNKHGNEAQWTSMRVLYVSDGDVELKTEGEIPAIDFVKKDILCWLNGDHQKRKVSWDTPFEVSNQMPPAEFFDDLEWKKETVGSYEWEVLRFEVAEGKVAKKKDEDERDKKYDGHSMSMVIAVTYAKPYTVIFSAPVIQDGYFGVPKKKTLEKINQVLTATWASVRIVKK